MPSRLYDILHPAPPPATEPPLPLTPLPSREAAPVVLRDMRKRVVVTPDPDIIAGVVRTLMRTSGLPTKEIARRMNTSPQTLNQYLRGARKAASFTQLARLAEVCGARVVIELE